MSITLAQMPSTTNSYSNPLVSLTKDPYPDLKGILNFFRKKYPDQTKDDTDDEILLLLRHVVRYEKHKRFFVKNKIGLDPTTLETFKTLKEYEDQSKLNAMSKDDPGITKLTAAICDEMVSLYRRHETKVKEFNSDNQQVTYGQSYGHINNLGQLVHEYTLSSETLKHRKTTTTDYNINLAKITLCNPFGESLLLLTRSGRSDTPSRILKLIQFCFLSSWESANKPGIFHLEKKVPSFLLHIYSGQDPHPIQNQLKKYSSSKKIRIDERTSLKQIKKQIDTLWENKKNLFIKVETALQETIIFKALKPILRNFVISSTAKSPLLIKESREWSKESTIRDFDLLRFSQKIVEHPHYSLVFNHFNQKFPKNSCLTETHLKDFFQDIANNDYIPASTDFLGLKIYYSIKGLCISLTDHDLNQKAYLSPHDPCIELIYHYYLSDLTNSMVSVQCKAGCDRALIMSSLFLAKKQIELKYHALIDLGSENIDQLIQHHYIDEFTKFCGDFGAPIIKICRAGINMKGLEKPILWHIFGPYLAETSIPLLKLVNGT